jgi:pilus assembly protein FimV
MAYNKTKYVETAQKYLHQGKMAQAIGEYQQILKHEPKDQITLMTVGDLFVRQGDTFQALEYFERLAQIYLADGFVTKAIAIYKKIAKLAPEETRPVEKLAELYVQQGVLSEARPIYLQLAELHQRANRPAQAAALLRKLLEAEPDNLRVQTRLAELSLAMGQKEEAAAAFCAAARQLLARGDHDEAIKYVDRALKTEPGDAGAKMLKVRVLAAGGKRPEAVSLLEADPNLEKGGEATDLLLDLYLEAGNVPQAAELATKIFAANAKSFAPAHRVASALLEADEADHALTLLDLIREPMTDSGEHESLSQSLTRATERLPGRLEPLQWLVDLFGRTSDSFRLPDALANLGQAYEAADKLEQALQVFEQLLDRDPENESARRECQKLRAQLGLSAAVAPPIPEPASPVTTFGSPAAPKVSEPSLDEETERFVSQALTDVDLFSSYGLTQKAIDLLETVLQRAPRHAVALERLFDLSLGGADDQRTAKLASQLEQIHRERGDATAADRFLELRRRFERAAGAAPAAAASAAVTPPQEFSIPVVEAKPVQEPPASAEAGSVTGGAAASSVHEVDLSDEWATLASQIEGVAESSPAQDAAAVAAHSTEQDWAADQEQVAAASAEAMPDFVLELDPVQETPASNASAGTADDILKALSAEFDNALPAITGAGPAAQAMRSRANPAEAANGGNPAAAQPPAKEPAGPLSEVFEEFRTEMGEHPAEEEDLETHYNLGIAYREMGLLEEAISEFQKVAKADKQGRPFRYAMQCCTLLGLAFMERGEPSIAAAWYERALETAALDPETILALRYDLGVAQELAGDTSAARKSFSQVYGMNIDYRDVSERLAALGKER